MTRLSLVTGSDAWRGAFDTASGIRVRDVMNWPALSVSATTTAARAGAIADEQEVHHLLVIHQRHLIGVLCTCDVRDAQAGAPVGSCMTQHVVTVHPDAPLTHALELMNDYHIDCLPSPLLGALGIVTRGDLVRARVCERRPCIACGSNHHVRRHPRYTELHHCVDCLSRDADDEISRLYRDLGGGD